MPMIPPLVRDPSLDGRQSSTARPVAARMVRTQRRYASDFNISFVYEPPPPIPRPGPAAPESTFDKWRAAAELDPHGGGAGDPPYPAAPGEAAASGVAAAPRRRLHDALLGTTAVVLLGVLGGIGYFVWSGAVPGVLALGGTAPQGSGVTALVQPFADFAAKAVTRAVPDPALPSPPGKDALADPAASRPVAPLAPLSVTPDRLAPAPPLADKPAVAGPPPPAPERAAAELAPSARPSKPDAAAPAPALPVVTAAGGPTPEPAATVAVPPAQFPEPVAAAPAASGSDRVAPAIEPAAAQAVPPATLSAPDAAPSVPAIAAAAVRLPAAPEWTTVPPVALASLASLAEAAPLLPDPPAFPAAPASPVPSAGPATASAEAARTAPPGVDAQQVVSTMTLVQQMSLLVHDMHDESLRYRTEVTALTGAVQAKASSLEERLKLAEARSASGAEGGGPRAEAGLPQVLRGYRVQAGSPGAAVLSEVGAGPERAARLLVMVGDQLPGAGRVTAIVQRGRAWIVRTERGVIE